MFIINFKYTLNSLLMTFLVTPIDNYWHVLILPAFYRGIIEGGLGQEWRITALWELAQLLLSGWYLRFISYRKNPLQEPVKIQPFKLASQSNKQEGEPGSLFRQLVGWSEFGRLVVNWFIVDGWGKG